MKTNKIISIVVFLLALLSGCESKKEKYTTAYDVVSQLSHTKLLCDIGSPVCSKNRQELGEKHRNFILKCMVLDAKPREACDAEISAAYRRWQSSGASEGETNSYDGDQREACDALRC
jgi:hypothetical protein